ncbi:MAG: aldo/keto reductase [Alphaproteobacteria bacterium]
MRYKKLGRSGLLVSEICLGTMTFGGEAGGGWRAIGSLEQKPVDSLVKASFDAGVNFLDTADVYSNGLSEQVTGQALKNLKLPRDEIVIATKAFGRIGGMGGLGGATEEEQKEIARRLKAKNVNGLSRKHLFSAIDASLKRLQLDYVDLYQIHGDDPLTPLEETIDALGDIVRSGRVRYIGLCNLPAWRTAKALGISERKNLPRFESMQMYYSIGGRDIEREVAPLAQEENLAILPWSPLAGGFFSGKFSRDGAGPNDARRLSFDFPPVDKAKGFDIIDAMKKIGDAQGVSVARIALAYLLHKPFVTSVIIGAKTIEQLNDDIAATKVQLNAADLDTLDKVSSLAPEYPGWMVARQGEDRRSQVL